MWLELITLENLALIISLRECQDFFRGNEYKKYSKFSSVLGKQMSLGSLSLNLTNFDQ